MFAAHYKEFLSKIQELADSTVKTLSARERPGPQTTSSHQTAGEESRPWRYTNV